MRVTLDIPDVANLTDDEIASIARWSDGRWSYQTKQALWRLGTALLDLNRAWAATPRDWVCPCCSRDKPSIARVSKAGIATMKLEWHHDHLADRVRREFDEANPPADDRFLNQDIDQAKKAVLTLVERFEPALLCLDCNLAEGRAKSELRNEGMDESFSFRPSEITRFIVVVAPTRSRSIARVPSGRANGLISRIGSSSHAA